MIFTVQIYNCLEMAPYWPRFVCVFFSIWTKKLYKKKKKKKKNEKNPANIAPGYQAILTE